MPGLRDEGALESAFARPRNKLAHGKRVDHATLAAACAFGLARNHPFNDGNKRIAFLVAVAFLGLNGWSFEAPDADVVAHMVALADRRLTEVRFAAWLRRGIRKLPRGTLTRHTSRAPAQLGGASAPFGCQAVLLRWPIGSPQAWPGGSVTRRA